MYLFFFQEEDGIRDIGVTGVQTCALPIYRGLSIFIVPKPVGEGHGFDFTQPDGGKMEGRAIDTLGYRGMHSYEIAFDAWRSEERRVGKECRSRWSPYH